MLSDVLSDGECVLRDAMTSNFSNLFSDAEWWPLLHEAIRQIVMLRMCLDHPKFDWGQHTPGTLDNVPTRVGKWDQYRALVDGDVKAYFRLTPEFSTKRKGSAKAQIAKKHMLEAVAETEVGCRWYICSPAWADFYRSAARCHDKPMQMLALVRMSLADLQGTPAFAAAKAGEMGKYYELTADIDAGWAASQQAVDARETPEPMSMWINPDLSSPERIAAETAFWRTRGVSVVVGRDGYHPV